MPEAGSRIWWAAGFVVLFAGLTALPHLLSYSQQEILVFLTINVLVVVSYRLLTLTGEWSLGHVVMVGVGAYASALFTKKLGGSGPGLHAVRRVHRRRHRLRPEFSPVPHEGVLLPDRLVCGG